MITVGIIGYRGRMGAALEEHLAGLSDVEVIGRLEQDDDIAPFISVGPDVAVDLSNGPGVDAHGVQICEAGIPYIIGATGAGESTLDKLREAAEQNSPVLLVPNFSIGANLMIEFAAKAARLMDDPVITERHHKGKLDAPSGTALHTAWAMGASRAGAKKAERTSGTINLPGVMGGDAGGVRVHSVRGDGYLAEQQVSLSLPGESLEISHRSIDRRCFMQGIEYAIRNIGKVSGFQVGLGALMEL